jgi:eukaryotic-like serine/threonine-protein kinase
VVTTTDGSANGPERPVPFGPFLLERRLAVGGSAEVFLARPRRGIRPAARFVVKRVLHRTDQDDAFRMLVHEAELNQAVRHPNVVEMYGAGQVDGEPYLAMEYVDGVDLLRLLRRAESEKRPLSYQLCAYIAANIAAALSAVHGATDERNAPLEIVHRDVTPSNVYLSNDGDIKLGDFGIARVSLARVRGPNTAAGLKGKFGYLAPEQIAGEPFDHRADLFALTVVLGEMLIGERIFPGSGQLAVLLAIRDGNFEPLRRRQADIPAPLYELCLRGLAREPSARFQSAAEFEALLRPFETPSPEELRTVLSHWVRWAGDSTQLTKSIQGQIRESVARMKAAREAQNSFEPPVGVTLSDSPAKLTELSSKGLGRPRENERIRARVRLSSLHGVEEIPFSRLVEMIATGKLNGDDEVALSGEDLRPIREIPALARYLAPSSTATTSRVFQVGIPDYQTQLHDTPLLEILGRLRQNVETGALFVERRDEAGTQKRKEIYLKDGRLLHVAASERDELLGEYLIRREALTRAELESALEVISRQGGRLGDTLVAMGIVDAVDVFRAIRDLGRDRVAALCSWTRGMASFYRGTEPTHVEFPLELDLTSPMMAGVLVATQGSPGDQLPDYATEVVPGPRAPTMASRKERGSVPIALLLLQQLATEGLSLKNCIRELTGFAMPKGARSITEKEAIAALIVARLLGWVSF